MYAAEQASKMPFPISLWWLITEIGGCLSSTNHQNEIGTFREYQEADLLDLIKLAYDDYIEASKNERAAAAAPPPKKKKWPEWRPLAHSTN